jgi:hypothetical protein
LGRCVQATRVHVEAEAAIGLDRPRCFISAIGATED